MKKLILFALCAALCLLTLISCHGAKDYDPFVIPEEFDESKEYNIVFWAKNEKNINLYPAVRKI